MMGQTRYTRLLLNVLSVLFCSLIQKRTLSTFNSSLVYLV